MTINEIITAKNTLTDGMFSGDFSGYYDISRDEAERIAAAANSLAEFENIWANEIWWKTEDAAL